MKNTIWACLWTCLFFSQVSNAKILKDDHYVIGEKEFSWEKVCKKLTKRDSPLIEYKSINELDCMGKSVKVIKYCDDVEAANPYFTRAIVSKNKKVIVCQSAKRVIIKWECEGATDKYCKDIDLGCFFFKEKLARRLKLAHKSLTDGKILNCYFDTQVNDINLN